MQQQTYVLLIILIGVYSLPAIVASSRHHHNMAAIMLTNLLLGWTALGWIAALIWAMTAVQKPEKTFAKSKQKKCPDCAEIILSDARICRFCGHDFAPKIKFKMPLAAATGDIITCAACHKQTPAGPSTCPHCGMALYAASQ